jgi:hypothetical protein
VVVALVEVEGVGANPAVLQLYGNPFLKVR